MQLQVLQVDAHLSFTLAVFLLIVGKILTLRWSLLRRYSIPEAVAGGLAFIAVVTILHMVWGIDLEMQLGARDFLLLVFFAGIGLNADIRALREGGRPLLVLTGISVAFMVIQNVAGVLIALIFGRPALEGLLVGSIPLTGGVGTTLAWAPILETQHGIGRALELGVASNTVGLVAACLIGGPMAAFLMARYRVRPSEDKRLEIGAAHENPPPLDYMSVLWAVLLLDVTVMAGQALHGVISLTGITLPAFVSCLVAGILIRALLPRGLRGRVSRQWPGMRRAMALLSELALGLFLVMALMGLKPWALADVLGFVTAALAVQIALTLVYTVFVVFRVMGRDYESVVISSGFSGITLGSTATAIANMTAVARQYGAARAAFVIVPLVCGFFIDLANAAIISVFVWLLG